MPEKEDESRAIGLTDELLARFSHDLRTPLAAILGWAKALQLKGSDPAVLERGLDAISRNAARQTRLLDELVDSYTILSGKLVLERRPVDVAAVAAAAIDTARPAADAKGVRLEAPADPPAATVAGDPDRLQQAVAKLLANAIESTPAGGRIEVLLQRRGGELALTVRDDGAGLDAASLARMLDPPGVTAAERGRGGHGLGLPIARQLVELHGGHIEATSAGPGAGASFVVRLPISS